LPTGATASFSPATVTGTGSSTLTVTTTGEHAGRDIHTDDYRNQRESNAFDDGKFGGKYTTAAPDFTVSASPSTQTVIVGNATTYTASIGALNGFGGVVTLGASGLPAGATAGFSPATVTGTGSSTLTVDDDRKHAGRDVDVDD